MLYNVAKKNGFVYNALAYQNKKRKTEQQLNFIDVVEPTTLIDEAEKTDMFNFFKRCVLPREKNSVKRMMTETKSYRREIILQNFGKYKEMWNFYFFEPDLVRF